jgi:hypothetical protein
LSIIIDPNKAEQFIKDFVSQTNNNNDITVCEVATEGPVDTTDNETNATIWKGKGRPTANDEEATATLLTLRGKYSSRASRSRFQLRNRQGWWRKLLAKIC